MTRFSLILVTILPCNFFYLASDKKQGDAEESEEGIGRPCGKEDGNGTGVAKSEHHPLKEVVGDADEDADGNADGEAGAATALQCKGDSE